MELSMDNMDIVAGGILAIMLALFIRFLILSGFAKRLSGLEKEFRFMLQ